MSFSYTSPGHSAEDMVRFLIGDTVDSGHLVEDADITDMLAAVGSPRLAAADICDSLAARFAQQVDKSVGPLRISASQRSAAFADRAKALRRRNAADVGGPSIGASSACPAFRRGMFNEVPGENR